jgi:putative hydrolase of the HAD superfamily
VHDGGVTAGVIFDLFGTLTGSEVDRDGHVVALAGVLGASPEDLRRLMRDSFDRRAKGQLGDLRSTFLTFCDELGLSPSLEMLERAIHVRMQAERHMLEPRHGAVALLGTLRDLGIKIGLLSDCTPEILDLWSELPYAALVDCTVRSCDVGWRKPDARMYRAVLEGLGLDASQCLYVGDGSSAELSGAAAVGLRPVLLRVPEEDYFRYDEEPDWAGDTIEDLGQVLTLLG